jgi:hypothetical protein
LNSGLHWRSRKIIRLLQPDIDRATDPLLRMATLPPKSYEGPQWKESRPANVAGFSRGWKFAEPV